MNSLYPQDWSSYFQILVVFLRGMGLFVIVPVFSHRAVPGRIKTLLALVLSFALYPIVKRYLPAMPGSFEELSLLVLRESAIGVLMGFAAYVTFEAISLGAQFAGYQMGFGSAAIPDPQYQGTSALVPLQGWLALMVFLFTDMHHQVIQVFVRSFELTAQLGTLRVDGLPFLNALVLLTSKLFWLAVRIAAPFTVLVLCCNVVIGVLARTIPQMNILLFSFPVTMLLGLCALYFLAPDLLGFLEGVLGDASSDMVSLLRSGAG
jgi:flagellar biosynthetic protein FliR